MTSESGGKGQDVVLEAFGLFRLKKQNLWQWPHAE